MLTYMFSWHFVTELTNRLTHTAYNVMSYDVMSLIRGLLKNLYSNWSFCWLIKGPLDSICSFIRSWLPVGCTSSVPELFLVPCTCSRSLSSSSFNGNLFRVSSCIYWSWLDIPWWQCSLSVDVFDYNMSLCREGISSSTKFTLQRSWQNKCSTSFTYGYRGVQFKPDPTWSNHHYCQHPFSEVSLKVAKIFLVDFR